MSYISFNGKLQHQERQLSLFEQLATDGKYIAHKTGIGTIWIEDNPADMLPVWVAEPKRVAIIEKETDFKITTKWVLA